VYDTDNMDADPQTCISSEHTAAKQHKCASCPAPIMPGQRYKRHYFPPADVYREHADPAVCYFADPEPGTRGAR
jgi:hypothetical protein